MRQWVRTSVLSLAAFATACGGGGGSGSSGTTASSGSGSSGTGGTCSLLSRQNWAAGVLNEWYLFPETLPASLDPAPYATVDDYINALTATARGQRRDRFFTYLTSIAQENAFFNSGSSAGFGFRIASDTTTRRAFILEAFEGTPALAAGIDRGTEVLAIGPDANNLRTVSDIIAAEGAAGVTNALGPSTAGLQRALRISDAGGTRTVTITKADYTLTPVSSRYGARIINDGGRQVGYVNLRTFISTADQQLRDAFSQFRQAGITNFIIDFRYNGGGLVSTAELIGDLVGGNRTTNDVFSRTTYRPEKSANNSTRRFAPGAQSVSPIKIAFIGTGSTASASELVINSMTPYYGVNSALIGTNTYGKPVGQIAVDRTACDDRLRVVAFQTENSAGQAGYFDGLAAFVGTSCNAADDYSRPLGDAQEASIRTALNYLGGVACTPISDAKGTAQQAGQGAMTLLTPDRPTVDQREVPGLF